MKNARTLAEKVRRGECDFDLIEVMACPGGCIGGAGQPVSRERDVKRLRTRGLYDADKNLDLHKSQENHHVTEMLPEVPGRNRRAQGPSPAAHALPEPPAHRG